MAQRANDTRSSRGNPSATATTAAFEAGRTASASKTSDSRSRRAQHWLNDVRPPAAAAAGHVVEVLSSPLASIDDSLTPNAILESLLLCVRRTDDARARAANLLQCFGSLSGVLSAEPRRLRETNGLDDLAITLLATVQSAVRQVVREPVEERPIIASDKVLFEYLSVTMRHDTIESVRGLFLDSRNALIKDEVLARGTVNHVQLYPREVVRRSIELGASALILVHNHPSGDPTPSISDIKASRELVDALKLINVLVHDHVIVGRNKEVSMRKMKLI